MVGNHTAQNNEDNENFKDKMYKKQKQEREEYMEKLKNWLDEARVWHCNLCSSFPYNQNSFAINTDQPFNVLPNSVSQFHLLQTGLQGLINNSLLNGNVPATLFQTSTHNPLPPQRPSTYEFVIPPLWKRAVAELMDFLLLFLFKMALTFILLESFDIIDMGFYGFESFRKNLENPDVAMPMAVELLTLELLHRVIVCAYETYFLKGKLCATPGKRYMGLMVITAESISTIPGRPNDIIIATGATPMGFRKSLSRAALKNLFVGLFLPLCVAFYIFPYNRTSYDMMANSIVVEYHQEFTLYNAAI